MNKALIAMSGGVDSSAAALIMKKAGYDCIGVTMKLHDGDGNYSEKVCCTSLDAEDARSVCVKLGIPHYVFNFCEDFKQNVIENFVHSYEIGETPNPCIDCNRYLKFDRLYRRAKELSAQYIVTGHYARVEYDEGSKRMLLKKALNAAKDQSYVLYFLTQKQLSHIKFPLGDFYDKDEVRKIAEENGLINAHKHESQDICFIPNGDYAEFIRKYQGHDYPAGDFIDINGNVLGKHKGFINYTIGQRKGLGISFSEPLYVCSKDVRTNRVTLSPEKYLYQDKLTAGNFNLISLPEPPKEPLRVTVRTRYHAKEAEAYAIFKDNGNVEVRFDENQRAICPGQAVVLYDGDIVVGGGTILNDNL